MLIVVAFVAGLAVVALLLAWFTAREVHYVTKRAGWGRNRTIAAVAGSFVVCSAAVFYSVIGVLMVVLQ